MDILEKIRQEIAPDIDRLSALIADRLATSNPLMDNVITNYLKSKGKLIRPIIVMLSARLFGPVTDKVLHAAASVELLHNASLIHDDVVDGSTMRRGRPTVNAMWDNHIAVLVGDFFVSTSMQQAIVTGDARIIESLCHLGKLLSLGELDQIYSARYHNLDEDAYFKIIEYKTASLFVACSQMGCYAQGVADERKERLSEFARLLGLCFQIRDDIFDYFPAQQDTVGKPTANDLREGKITLPLLHVLRTGTDAANAEMVELSKKASLDEDDIARLTAYAIDGGGIDYAYAVMEDMRTRAVALLDGFDDGEAKKSLIELFGYIISRRY